MGSVAQSLWPALDEPILLAILEDEPVHGYAAYQWLQSILGDAVRKSQVYQTLNRLEEKGMTQSTTVDGDGSRRRVYEPTEEGLTHLSQYRSLPKGLDDLLASIFTAQQPSRESPTQEEAPPRRSTDEDAWVPTILDQLPDSPETRAPHAKYSVERSPNQGRWTLHVEHHEPANYKHSEACPLTFLYLAMVDLLLKEAMER